MQIKFQAIKKKLGIYGRFLTAYLLFLIFVFIFSFYAVYVNQNFIKSETLSHRKTQLDSTINTISIRLKEVENIVYQLGNLPGINSFLNMNSISGKEYFQLQKTWKSIPDYTLGNEFIEDLFIYFKNSDVLMSSQKASYRSYLFYDTMIRYPRHTYDQWMDQMVFPLSSNHYFEVQEIEIDSFRFDGLTLAQSLPMSFNSNLKGTVLAILRANILTDPLESIVGTSGKYQISDSDGTKLLSSFADSEREIASPYTSMDNDYGYKEISIEGERWFLISSRSDSNGWSYSVALPESIIFLKVNNIRRLTLLLAFIAMMLIIPGALLIAHFNSLPFRRIFRSVSLYSGKKTNSGPIELIENAVDDILTENTRLTRSLEDQDPIMRNRTIERIIRGRYKTEEALRNALEVRKIYISGDKFLTVTGMLESGYGDINEGESLQRLNLFAVLVQETIQNLLGDRALSCNFEEDIIAIVISVEDYENFRSELENLLGNIKKTLHANHGLNIVFAGGSLRESIMDMYISTIEALNTLEHIKQGNTGALLWYDAVGADSTGYYYPFNLEHRLSNFIRSGQQEQVRTLFSVLWEENFDKRDLSRSDVRSFLREVVSTIAKTFHSLNEKQKDMLRELPLKLKALRDSIRAMKSHIEGKAIYDEILKLTGELHVVIDDAKLSHNDKLINDIRTYIENNYRDFNLSLAGIADNFKLTEAYLSNFFKEQAGSKYSAYIEQLRIGKAKELLEDDISIADIVSQIGYVSKNTFYKAFKRSEGISPGAYREQIR